MISIRNQAIPKKEEINISKSRYNSMHHSIASGKVTFKCLGLDNGMSFKVDTELDPFRQKGTQCNTCVGEGHSLPPSLPQDPHFSNQNYIVLCPLFFLREINGFLKILFKLAY